MNSVNKLLFSAFEVLLRITARRLLRTARTEEIQRILREQGRPNPPAPAASATAASATASSAPASSEPAPVRAAVVQEQIRILPTLHSYTERMHAFVRQAAGQGAQLICFPEENGLLLLGQIPWLRWALRRLGNAAPAPAPRIPTAAPDPRAELPLTAPESSSAPDGLDIPRLFAILSPFLNQAFTAIFSELARAYGVYIMAGSMMIVENGRLFNRAYLFGPDGALLGVQNKAHPVELEMDLQMSCADTLSVLVTPLGKLAFPVCMDATYFETFKILQRQGAEIVIIPIANLEPYEEYFALRGIWPRVQESGVFGLKSALVGRLFGLEFTGKAGIFAPLALTPDQSGVLAEAHTYDQDEICCADLDRARLHAYVSPYFSDTNPDLYQKYFPQIYQK